MTASVAVCGNHPARAAIAACRGCGALVCDACSTPLDGIHVCARCVPTWAETGGPGEQAPDVPTRRTWSRVAATLWFAFLFVLSWTLVEVALPGGG